MYMQGTTNKVQIIVPKVCPTLSILSDPQSHNDIFLVVSRILEMSKSLPTMRKLKFPRFFHGLYILCLNYVSSKFWILTMLVVQRIVQWIYLMANLYVLLLFIHMVGQIQVLGRTLRSMLRMMKIENLSYSSLNISNGMNLYIEILFLGNCLRKYNKRYLKCLILSSCVQNYEYLLFNIQSLWCVFLIENS